jgi:hypothetical protein
VRSMRERVGRAVVGAALTLAACAALPLLAPLGAATPGARVRDEARAAPDLVVGRDMIRRSLNLRRRRARDEQACIFVEGCIGGVGRRRTLEFDTAVINQGNEDLTLGDPSDNREQYEFSPCHGHYHLKGSLEYALSRGGNDTVSFYEGASGGFRIRNAHAEGPADFSFSLGTPGPGRVPIAGDWNGDGTSTAGLYDPATTTFYLTDAKNPSALETIFKVRVTGANLQSIAGDWDGDGNDSVGLFDPATGTFHLKNANTRGRAETVFAVPLPASAVLTAIAGDWDGDDDDTVGLYDASTGTFALRNSNAADGPETRFEFGGVGQYVPVTGDWDQDGDDTIGLWDPATGNVRLRNASAAGEADLAYAVADAVGLTPIAGDWDYNIGETLPTVGHKQAFCWLDTQRVSGERERRFDDCDTNQGLTAGWSDLYVRGTDCQWIDIEGVPAGTYQLQVAVNTQRVIRESDYTNNVAAVKVRIPEPRNQAAPATVSVTAPARGRRFRVGEPMTIRWKVGNGRRVTHQQIWIYRAAADGHQDHTHLNETMLVDGNIAASARSYTWTPTEDFAVGEAFFVVRAQDDRNLVGGEARTPGSVRIEAR